MLIALSIILAVALVVLYFDKQRLASKAELERFKGAESQRRLSNELTLADSQLKESHEKLVKVIAQRDQLKKECGDLRRHRQDSERALRLRILEAIGEEPDCGPIPKHRATNEGEYSGIGKSLLDSIPEADGAQSHTLPDEHRDDDTIGHASD